MPVARICPYCNKKLLTSSYGMWEHIQNKCIIYKKMLLKEKKEALKENKGALKENKEVKTISS